MRLDRAGALVAPVDALELPIPFERHDLRPRAELDGIGLTRHGELIDVRLAREGVRGCGERSIGALRER